MPQTPRKRINLEDWYTNEEATRRLSENSGRPIDKNYPRTLARAKKIESLNVGARGKLYLKKDIDVYIVSEKRGRKSSKKEKRAA
ncbi:MAG: hypothetical protein M3Z24_10295 [Chloroflexota bacterium]|nr:hypothetical protein [Chloroflexota bacterium]